MKHLLILLIVLFNINNCMAAKRTIKFAVNVPSIDKEDRYVDIRSKSFDVDVAKAMCQQMQAKCLFEAANHHQSISGLQSGEFDAVITAEHSVKQAGTTLDITKLFNVKPVFLSPANRSYNPVSIIGKKVGVARGSHYLIYLRSKYHSKINIMPYASTYDALVALTNHNVDLVLLDKPTALSWLKKYKHQKKFSIVNELDIYKDSFTSGYRITIRRQDKKLINAFNKALYDIKKDGTYQKIASYYFMPVTMRKTKHYIN